MKKFLLNPWIIGIAVIVFGSIGYAAYSSSTPGEYDDFAKCLGDKGAIFYGAFWCPHCKEQKQIFGKSAKYLPYIECALPSGQGTTEVCNQAGVKSYPTWEFADGTKQTGKLSILELSRKTNCSI
ncbi:MAG: hypothetical protein AABX51_03965 [Nanoarchaeota archaeon]